MILTLPYPPSVNTYWRANGKRRFISKAGMDFKASVQDYVINQKIPKLGTARLRMDIVICPRSRRVFDIDNLLKAILDALMDAGVYEDDSQVDDLHIVRGQPVKGGAAVVVIEEIDG